MSVKTLIYAGVFTLCVLFSGACRAEVKKKITSEGEKKVNCFPNLVIDSLTLDIAVKELEASREARSAFDRWIADIGSEAMSSEAYGAPEITLEALTQTIQSANRIYAIAVSWLFMDKDKVKADLYLQRATSLIAAWASVNRPSSHTPRESTISPIYEAYSIIRNHIDEKERTVIDQWIRKRADYYSDLSLTGNLLENNWNTIRINLLFYYAQILDDELLYNNAVAQLKSHIELNILESGVSHDFVNRDALAYHAYNMLFYARILKAVAMCKDKEMAMELYSHKNKEGSSIKSCVEFWEPYLMDPSNNIHLEFVNTQWTPDKERSDYNKPYHPMGTVYVLDELRFIEPKCAVYVDNISSANKYGRTFDYWINAVR